MMPNAIGGYHQEGLPDIKFHKWQSLDCRSNTSLDSMQNIILAILVAFTGIPLARAFGYFFWQGVSARLLITSLLRVSLTTKTPVPAHDYPEHRTLAAAPP